MAPSAPARSRSGKRPESYLKLDTGPTTPPWETRQNEKHIQENVSNRFPALQPRSTGDHGAFVATQQRKYHLAHLGIHRRRYIE